MARRPLGAPVRLKAGRGLAGAGLAVVIAALAACSAAPRNSEAPAARPGPPERAASPPPVAAPAAAEREGVAASPPADLASVPDAEPRIEAVRSGGPNKPYEVQGQSYVPQTRDAPFRQRGMASWYGPGFHGKRTASGEVYNMYAMTAAHPTLPLPSYVRVRNPANGAEVVLRINDRGPFHGGRIIDLSYTAAVKLGVQGGVAPVELERITFDDIRTGAWRRPAGTPMALAQAAPAALPAAVSPPPAAMPAPTARAAARKPAAAPIATPRSDPFTAVPVTVAVLPIALGDAPSSAAPAAEAASAPGSATAAPSAPETGAAAPAAPPAANVAPGYWVQLGAFQQRAGADGFHRRVAADVDWLAPLLAVFSEPPLHRLQAGPYASRDEALSIAQRVREALKLVPVVLERR